MLSIWSRICVRQRAGTLAVTWECDTGNRKVIVTYEGKVRHEVVMDGEERLLLGYDQGGVPVVYTR